MQPGVAWQVWTMPGLPLAVTSAETAGQVTVVPKAGPLCQVELVADRKLVKMNVSPEESTRRTGTIPVDGRVTPGFRAVMAGVVPLGDLALVDLGQDVSGQLEAGHSRQVVVDRLGGDGDGDVHQARVGGELAVAQVGVGAADVARSRRWCR